MRSRYAGSGADMPVQNAGMVHLTSAGGTTLTLPATITVFGIPKTWRNVSQQLADKAGSIYQAGPLLEPFDFTIQGPWIQASASAARTAVDNLMKLLSDSPVKVRLMGASDTRYLFARPSNVTRTILTIDQIGQLNLGMHVDDPYMYGNAVTVTKGVTTGTQTLTIVNSGNVPAFPTIVITCGATANFSGLRIKNMATLKEIVLANTFTNGQVIKVDTLRTRATRSGVNILNGANQTWLLDGWSVQPGTINIQVSGTGIVALASTVVTTQPRWL